MQHDPGNRRCHCFACQKVRDLRREIADIMGSMNGATHGTASRYNMGCRCDSCRAGARDYKRNRTQKRAAELAEAS